MTLDFQQIHEQVVKLGENAPRRQQELIQKKSDARLLLHSRADDLEALRSKVFDVVEHHDPNLRCALPVKEKLDAGFPLRPLTKPVTILAADGSQINPDRHAEVEYCLINVGAIQMRLGAPEPPQTYIDSSRLFYDEGLYTASGTITEGLLALKRDLEERKALVDIAAKSPPPVITFTDGPMELWGAKDSSGEEGKEYRKSLEEYKGVLSQLCKLQVTTAGYVDKPAADLVVRLLEVAATSENELEGIRNRRPFRGVRDRDLYERLLPPGERSAIFAIQSKSAEEYPGPLALHFFYLNVGREGRSSLARVEVPAWVVESPEMLEDLQAVLVEQCQALGNRRYPYLLHRAHEAARVSMEEQEEVKQMILFELRKRGVEVGEESAKQGAKDLPGRTRYEL